MSTTDDLARDVADAMGAAYALLYDEVEHDRDTPCYWAMHRALVEAGESWVAAHPRMYRRVVEARGDACTSDREVAALGMAASHYESVMRKYAGK